MSSQGTVSSPPAHRARACCARAKAPSVQQACCTHRDANASYDALTAGSRAVLVVIHTHSVIWWHFLVPSTFSVRLSAGK